VREERRVGVAVSWWLVVLLAGSNKGRGDKSGRGWFREREREMIK